MENKNIITVEAFIGKNHPLLTIIKELDLSTVDDWTSWSDGFGNYIKLKENRDVFFRRGKEIDDIKKYDPYMKRNPVDLMNMSKFILSSEVDSKLVYFMHGAAGIKVIYNDSVWNNSLPLAFGVRPLIILLDRMSSNDYSDVTTEIITGKFIKY